MTFLTIIPTSPLKRTILEDKTYTPSHTFTSMLAERLENEKKYIEKKLLKAEKKAAKKELIPDGPEVNKIEAKSNELALSSEVSSSAVLSSQIDSELVLTPIAEEMPRSVVSAPTFFSPAAHSESYSSPRFLPSVQMVSLNNENGVWQRCLELRGLLGFVADPTDIEIGESTISNADEAKQKYVNIISFVEDQPAGAPTLPELKLIERALALMMEMEDEISIRYGRIVATGDIAQLLCDINDFIVGLDGALEIPASVVPIAEDLPRPLAVSSSVLLSEAESSLMRSMPSLSSPIASHPPKPSVFRSFFPHDPSFPTIHLSEENIWERCLELRDLLGLPANSVDPRKLNSWSLRSPKQHYVNTIAWVEKKFQETGVISVTEATLVRKALEFMMMTNITTPEDQIINPDSIAELYGKAYHIAVPNQAGMEEYADLREMQAKLAYLQDLVQPYGLKYSKLLNNIMVLQDSIKAKLDDYENKYCYLQPCQQIRLPHPFPRDLPAQDALEILMEMVSAQFSRQLPADDRNSHIFTPRSYERSNDKFQSVVFSLCSTGDIALPVGPNLLSAEKRDTVRLKKELEMLGIPARVERSHMHRFQHENNIVGGVRIVFDCVDPLIFNVAIELQSIRYQYAPRSLVADIPQEEPAVLRSSLISSSLFLGNSDAGQNLNPNPNPSPSSRFGK